MLVNIHKPKLLILFLMLFGLWLNTEAQIWTLQNCLDTAVLQNKNLEIGKNNILLSEQKQKEVKANLLPKVNLNADYRYFVELPYQLMPLSLFGGQEGLFKEAQFGVPHNINANIQFAMPLYNPQIYGAIQTTKIVTELRTLQYQKSKEQLYFDISNYYFNAQLLLNQLDFIEKNLENSQKLLANIQLLKEQLLAKGSDVNKIALQVQQLQSKQAIVKSKYEQVLNGLKFVMGVSLDTSLEIEKNIKYQANQIEQENDILDIQLVQTQKKLLFSELNTLKNARLPSISLYGNYGTTGYAYTTKPNDFLKFFPIGSLGLKVSYSLFDGTRQKKMSQKNIELANNDLQLELLSDKNTMLVQNAKSQRQVTEQTIKTSEAQIKLAQIIYEQSILQQKEGLANLTDVLLADNALREAQQNYLSTVIDYLKADLELKKLTNNW